MKYIAKKVNNVKMDLDTVLIAIYDVTNQDYNDRDWELLKLALKIHDDLIELKVKLENYKDKENE